MPSQIFGSVVAVAAAGDFVGQPGHRGLAVFGYEQQAHLGEQVGQLALESTARASGLYAGHSFLAGAGAAFLDGGGGVPR